MHEDRRMKVGVKVVVRSLKTRQSTSGGHHDKKKLTEYRLCVQDSGVILL